MEAVYINPQMSESGKFKIVKLEKQDQNYTYVAEVECNHDEKWLAAMWACVSPTKRYATKEFNTDFFPLITPEE